MDIVEQVTNVARSEAINSSLPGYYHGPADAVTHIVGSAELRRRAGNGNASFIVTANELSSRAQKGNYSAASDMDDANNAIGLAIGETARSYEEVVARARDAIARGIESGGSGANGTPVWLAPAEWGGDRGRTGIIRDRIVWEPRPAGGGTYAQGGPNMLITPTRQDGERRNDCATSALHRLKAGRTTRYAP